MAVPDLPIRLAAFDWLRQQNATHDGVLPRSALAEGFVFGGEQIRLVGPQGIFKPRLCALPLAITSIVEGGPYPDGFEDGHLWYAYRGTDPNHVDNVGLRRAMAEHVPLVLCCRIEPNAYVVTAPVYVVGEDHARLRFEVQVDDRIIFETPVASGENRQQIRREYVTSSFRRRVHQRRFREQVLDAYRKRCALCRLRHIELLDAAHIIGDLEEEGDPVVSNGLALCKLHHAAFDSFFFAVRPDYTVEVRRSILEETDGPMLLVGLKQIHGQRIELPRSVADRPDRDRLESRYARFLAAS